MNLGDFIYRIGEGFIYNFQNDAGGVSEKILTAHGFGI